MTLANKLTILRILLIPIFVITLINSDRHLYMPLIIFSLAIITDAMDGFIARKKKQRTPLGSFLDPIADKLLMLSSYIILTLMQKISAWITVIICSRDLIIVLGWGIRYIITNDTIVKARILGKITACFQMLTIFLILCGINGLWKGIFLEITIFFTILSGMDYILVGIKILNNGKSRE